MNIVDQPDGAARMPVDTTPALGFRIPLAWRFFLFFAVLLGLVLGTALLVTRVPDPLLLIAAIALLVAGPAAFLLAKATLQPLAKMASAAQEAVAGNYQATMGIAGEDEFAQLSQAFDALCADLRERAALGAYAARASRGRAEGAEDGVAPRLADVPGRRRTDVRKAAATHGQLAVLALDLRQFVDPLDAGAEASALASMAEAARALVATALRHGGRLLTAGGTRLIFGFEGSQRLLLALVTAREAMRTDARTALALLEGEVAGGAIEFEPGVRVPTLFGPAAQQIERLLTESAAERILLPRGLGDAAKALLGEAHVSVTQGLMSGKPYYSMGVEALAALPATAELATADNRENLPAATDSTRIAGRYELLAALGRGAYGAVYTARDLQRDDLAAIELPDPDAAADVARLERNRDAIVLSCLVVHPNVLRTLQLGEHEGRPYLATECVTGATLEQGLQHCGRMPFVAALHLARQLCAGLAAAHARGLLHRDIRPGNIVLEPDGTLKLAGFGGIALPVLQAASAESTPTGPSRYAAPELLAGGQADVRADIYAYGVVLREIVDVAVPFADAALPAPGELAAAAPARVADAGVSAATALEVVIRTCLDSDPDLRYPSTVELGAALDRIRT